MGPFSNANMLQRSGVTATNPQTLHSKLALQVLNGEVDLEQLDESSMTEEEVYAVLLGLPGVGPFTGANMLQLLGHYRRIPCDSETVRHLRKAHGVHQCTQADVQHYADKVSSVISLLKMYVAEHADKSVAGSKQGRAGQGRVGLEGGVGGRGGGQGEGFVWQKVMYQLATASCHQPCSAEGVLYEAQCMITSKGHMHDEHQDVK